MKFRTLGVALLMGSGLALTAALPAVAQPYPPAGCSGPFGTGTVNPAVVAVGEETTFSGCGFEPFTIVQIAVDGVPYGSTLAKDDTTFTIEITFTTEGAHALTATGQQATTFNGASSNAVALPTDDGAVAVQVQAPFLTRAVSATVLVTEKKHEWPGHGHGGWGGEPSGDPSGEPSTDPSATVTSTSEPTSTSSYSPTSDPTATSSYSPSADPSSTSYPTDEPTSYPTDEPTSYPTDEPTTYPTADPSAGPGAREPVETVYPHDWDGKHRWNDEGEQREGGLPFTGVETGALAAIAVALVGGGLLIRVAARKRRNAPGTHS